MNYAYLVGYEMALEKIGFHNTEILNALKTAREKIPSREGPEEAKIPGGNAPRASKIPGAKQFGRLPTWGKGALIGGAGLAAGAGLSHLLSKKDKE
jgi:hypothetical protein